MIGKLGDIPFEVSFDGNWKNIEQFKKIGEELVRVARALGYKCSYGGHWKLFQDWPHFQLE